MKSGEVYWYYLLTILIKIKKEFIPKVNICLCSSCKACGSDIIFNEFKNQIKEYNLNIELKTVACTGVSYQAPLKNLHET